MANRHRGDVAFTLDGRTHALRLTLGSLAHLEDALGADGLSALGERLSSGRLSARDIRAVLEAGFIGVGEARDAERLARDIPASALEAAALAATGLLASAFGATSDARPTGPQAA